MLSTTIVGFNLFLFADQINVNVDINAYLHMFVLKLNKLYE